jgi:glycosyltransferase involved in cell wall biosynthesis
MPTINRPEIQRAIDSFNNQDYKDKELIIVDDTKLKIGQAGCVNYGIHQAKGDYICLLHDDDELPEGSLSKRVKAFKKGIDFVYGKHIQIRDDKIKEFDLPVTDSLFDKDLICTGSLMWRKDTHLKIGHFDNTLKSYHDLDWKIRLMDLNGVIVDEFVYTYYRHSDSESYRNSINGIWKKEQEIIKERYAK